MRHHFMHAAFALAFCCTTISAEVPAKSAEGTPAVTAPSLVGEWQSIGFGSAPIEKRIKSMRYHFRPDGKFLASVEFTDGEKTKLEGSYLVRGATLEITVPDDGTDEFPYSLADGVLTLHDPKANSYVKLKKSIP